MMPPIPSPPPPPAIVEEQNATSPAPDWAKDAIWIQIFPERFRNGAPQSNPRPEDIGGIALSDWRISPWGMEWYARDDWEKPFSENFWSTVFQRRFGGDLVGLREKLPYLETLGITAIYLNPIFWAPSLHKYDATAYHHIDPTLGPDRDGDLRAIAAASETEDPATWIWTSADLFFLDLVRDIHARGMKIILDGVFNHSGTRFFAFQDIQKHGHASKYANWMQVTLWNDDGTFEFASWDGTGHLPNFGRNDNTLHAGIQKYLFDATRRWMDPSGAGRPEDGVDGWRLDVAYCLPHEFWREWHAHIRSINPAAYTTAEIVGPAQDWVKPDEFSAVMNYEWTYPTLSFFTPSPSAISVSEFRERINTLHARHSASDMLVMQNLLDSHDTGRILTLFESACPPFTEWNTYFNWAKVADNPALKTSRPGPAAKQALKLAAAWQFAGLGAPMIYYGTEVGMWGANDPCDRQPMLWNDIENSDETQGFRAPLTAPQSRAPDMELLAFYQRLITIRKSEPALRRGTFRWLPAPSENTIAFEREWGGEKIWCIIHKGPTAIEIALPAPARDLITGENQPIGFLQIPGKNFRIIKFQPTPL